MAARTHLEHSLHLSETLQSPVPTFRDGFVSGVTSLTWLTLTLWALGYADQAQQRSQEALALARQVGHSLSVVYTELLPPCSPSAAATWRLLGHMLTRQ